MKEPELMMYRVAIGQILADAGINRTTIMEMVKASIDEKVEKYVAHAVQGDMRAAISNYRLDEALKKAVEAAVRNELRNIKIEVTTTDMRKNDNG